MTSMQTANYPELIQADRVHGRLYYDPAIFDEELEKIRTEDEKAISPYREVPP